MNLKIRLLDGYTLIKSIEKCAKENNLHHTEVKLIEELINSAPEIDFSMWNDWIHIDQGPNYLPEKEGYYLVTAEDDIGEIREMVTKFIPADPATGSPAFWGNYSEAGRFRNIAWTTLPEPYEES